MTRIWLVNWHFQSRITLWCRHKSTNVSMGLCWQMPKFIVWFLWSIYFDHHLPLKPSIGKRRKQSCAPNICIYIYIYIYIYMYKQFNKLYKYDYDKTTALTERETAMWIFLYCPFVILNVTYFECIHKLIP